MIITQKSRKSWFFVVLIDVIQERMRLELAVSDGQKRVAAAEESQHAAVLHARQVSYPPLLITPHHSTGAFPYNP